MNISKELLSAKNYTGARRIEIKSPMVTKYKKEIDKYQKQAMPFLLKIEKISKVLDPFYAKINEHTEEINKIKAEMADSLEEYQKEIAEVELIDKKAQAIKNKLQPIVDDLIKGKLGEFEKPVNLTSEKGFHYVEVTDELEDYIKSRRARAGKK